jgi:hypothetical protein
MQEAISLSTEIETRIQAKLSQIFTLLKEDRARLDGSVAINSWGDGYTAKDTYNALTDFSRGEAPNVAGKERVEGEEADFSLRVRDIIADIFEALIKGDARLADLVRSWKDKCSDDQVLTGLVDWQLSHPSPDDYR